MLTSVLAVDESFTVAGLQLILTPAQGYRLVAGTANVQNVPALLDRHQPDLVLLNPGLPGATPELLSVIGARSPRTAVVVMTGEGDRARFGRYFTNGAVGVILKEIAVTDLPAILRQIVGRTIFTAAVEGSEAGGAHGLSKREREILGLVARGLSNKQIGRELWVTDQTVKFHLTNAYRKLEVSNRTAAIYKAIELGVVSAHEPALA